MADLSVIIPTHNRARLVKQAIDSVLAQTEPVREILVVNDNSSDDTDAVLREYGDAIRVFPASVGACAGARNVALRVAQGSWIGFLDDDDLWLPTKVEQQMALVRKNPSLGLVFSADYAVNDDLEILRSRLMAPEHRGNVFEKLLRRNFIFQSCALARRDLVERAGYMDASLKFAPDWDLWLKIAVDHAVDFAPEPLALCRHSPTGCLTQDMKRAAVLAEMRSIMERAMRSREISSSVRRRARYELEVQFASSWLVDGRNWEALPHCLRAVAYEPHLWEGQRLLVNSLVPRWVRDWAKRMVAGSQTA